MSVSAIDHGVLSRFNARFLAYASEERNCLQKLPLLDGDLPPFLQHHPYELNSWPIFIGPAAIAELTESAQHLPTLVLRCLDRERSYYFKRIQAVCHFDEALIERFFAFDVSHQIVARLDMVGTVDGLKVLEINSGSDIGGWEMSFFDRQYRKQEPLHQFMQDVGEVTSRNILLNYVRSLVAACESLGFGADRRLHFLFVVEPVTLRNLGEPMALALRGYGEQLGYDITIRFETSLAGVHPHEGGIGIDGRRIHAYMAVVTDVKAPVNATIFDAFCDGQIVWPDNPISACINDKALLADAYLASVEPDARFNDEERAVLRRHLTWASRMTAERVRYDGDMHDLRQLLTERKDEFVIKPVVGGQGKHVNVGRCQTREAWEETLAKAFDAPTHWLVQRFCESRRFYALSAAQGAPVVVDYVWGVFSYSGSYGGTWVRLKPIDSNTTGVINSHTGAQETIVYEVPE